MFSVAIVGAGPIGAATAHRLAERGRARSIRLIDESAGLAAGKALDIRQSGPIGRFDTEVTGSDQMLDAAGADVVGLADDAAAGEWEGERGLSLVRQLVRAGTTGPIVFAGPKQVWLMEAAVRELGIRPDRVVGTAASAAVNIARSLVHIELGETGADVSVTGRPPALVVAWSSATIGGALLTDRVAPHRLLALSQMLRRFWPPGPQAISAPTALAVEWLASGSRSLLPVMSMVDGEFGARGAAALLPAELGHGAVLRRVMPSLSPQERTEATSAVLGR